MGKMTKSSFKIKDYSSNDILELTHTNLCGPIGVQSYYVDKYFILFVDGLSRMMILIHLKEKCVVIQMFKWYLVRVEKEIDESQKYLRSDRGGKFISKEFNTFYNEKGIKRQMSAPRTPSQNGINERRNRSIMDYARTQMLEKNVSQKY